MINNISKQTVIVLNHSICKSHWCQAIGLMFSKQQKEHGLVFDFRNERKVSLHMFFVFYPIDVLFLNSKKKVVDVKQDFKPFTFYTSKERVKYVLELPLNTINGSKTMIDDLVRF
ncbi:MAG: DUF192 domain-containing protein [Nanoarchaeota archaeon]|nr:DUF192 domain-containing protein [Nanoarchaeota archaeon]MBU1854988.1 DUF192 domain-containing protein [Nanoarchaeota archaeon]